MRQLARADVSMRSVLAAISCMACFMLVIGLSAAPVAAQEASGKPARTTSAREAKNRKAKAAKARKDKRSETTQVAPAKPDEAQVVRESAVNDAEAERKSQAARDAAADASQEDVRKEGDSEVKVMEFSGLDIEGQLKTPQMLYFLNRLRAEFGRPDLPHRSFMPELSRATKEKAF